MKDTIIKGTGNSRTIKCPQNIASITPDFGAWLQKLVTDGVPIDIGPINPAGCDVVGTPLDAAHLVKIETGRYIGTGIILDPNNRKTIIFSTVDPKLVFVSGPNDTSMAMVKPHFTTSVFSFGEYYSTYVEWGDNSVTFGTNSTALNIKNYQYYYIAFG